MCTVPSGESTPPHTGLPGAAVATAVQTVPDGQFGQFGQLGQFGQRGAGFFGFATGFLGAAG